MAWELTTVADDEVVAFDGVEVAHWIGLEPDTEHDLDGLRVRTLPATIIIESAPPYSKATP